MHSPLWTPTAARVAKANLTRFMDQVRRDWGRQVPDHAALHRWSVEQPEEFWQGVWTFTGVISQTPGETVLAKGHLMPGARWFPDARLNFAENLLRRRDDSVAIVFRGENELRRSLTFAGLHDQVSRLVQALRAAGVTAGDRVAGYLPNIPEAVVAMLYLPNIPEAVVAMLATTSIGAIWSSCSPDFGVQGVVDRFGQIEPKVLFCADGYHYNGRRHDSLARLSEILRGIPSIEQVVVVANTREAPRQLDLDRSVSFDELCAGFSASPIRFEQLAFDHPVYVMYSSGTTGPPKCIVHGAGGTLIQHLKEHQLHVDVKPGDRLFYFTTCGWMMWNEETAMTVFGTSAKYIDAVKKEGLAPRETHDLSSLRTVLSTGSPLAPESFEFVYEKIKPDVCLSSISGGTDIISCFVLGSPLLPVWSGEIQCRGLGMAVEVFDGSGRAVRGEKGELVCTAPFPSMPVGFWRDPEGRRYREAYFEKFDGVWCHGDYAELTEHDGVVIHGRSDAVLNPGGVRIGTAEIYRQVEQLDEVLDSLVIGQKWQGDVRVVLFVLLREGKSLDDTLRTAIRARIRRHTTPRHVPAKIVQVTDIPRTKSGKSVELAVRDLVHGRPVRNEEALANPEALAQFQELPELQS